MTGTKSSINWDHVHERFNWMARDGDTDAYLYNDRPEPDRLWNGWTGWAATDAGAFASFVPGTCPWDEDLVCRPGYEGEG